MLSRRRWLLLFLIWLAFTLRLWQLPQTPPGLWYDEAYYSMDAAWLLDGGPWRIFFVGNNGREPIFIYLQALFIWIFGATPFTSRLIGPLVGTLTVPLVYVLARRLARGMGRAGMLVPYLAAAGLAISFWHLGLSRSGYRGILLPFAAAFLFYAFWRGWQERSLRFMILAGLALGLSQYTYLAARALPLVFGLFALIWTALFWLGRNRRPPVAAAAGSFQPAALWLAVGLMALVSALVFAPLGWVFYHNPSLFSARTGDVIFTPDTPAELLGHLWQALRLFIDNGDPNWRHHLPGRPMLGWLGWLGFWPGLLICLRRFRQPPYLFLLVALLLLYLPALLSTPPVHALRLSTLLPVYYLIFALGLVELARWLDRRHPGRQQSGPARFTPSRRVIAALLVVMLLETGLTSFDYFGRWARAEETYVQYNTPLLDFVNHVVALTAETPVIIPLQIYVHPTTRYLLHDHFVEQPAPETLTGPVRLVTLPDNFRLLNVANIPELPAFAWLARRPDGQGVVYISRPPRMAEQRALQAILAAEPEIYRDRFERELAYFRTLNDPAPIVSMFTDLTPRRTIRVTWPGRARLDGYEVTPELVEPNRPVTLNLYWRSLTELAFDDRLFIQIVDGAGNPINQWEGDAFSEDMYRWRSGGILPTQHTLWVGPDTPPGPYLLRLGFFDRRTGERLPLQAGSWANGGWTNDTVNPETPPADQIHLGLFYVTADGTDPRQPQTPLTATFADTIDLTGITLPQSLTQSKIHNPKSKIEISFHWQARRPTEKPYTVFLQLLDDQGQVVAGWDSQPFNGLYPTNLWSPGEIIVDTFQLPLPDAGLPPGRYRLISGFYDFETGQRLPLAAGGDFADLATFSIN